MKLIRAIGAVLALVVLIAVPAFAQDGDTVRKTFRVTVYGEVPGDHFIAGLVTTREEIERNDGDPRGTAMLFCGQLPTDEPVPPGVELITVSDEDCIGGGEAYTADVEVEQGAEITYFIVRSRTSDESDIALIAGSGTGDFKTTYETINTDTTNSFFYDGDTGKGGEGDGPGLPEPPDTGAGGMATGAGLPLGGTAAGVTMLIACGYAVRRQRLSR